MIAINHGGPAFPCMPPQDTAAGSAVGYPHPDQGMTLRDYMAVHADIGNVDELTPKMGALLLGRPCPPIDDLTAFLAWWADYRSALRYIEADAMLRAREVKP